MLSQCSDISKERRTKIVSLLLVFTLLFANNTFAQGDSPQPVADSPTYNPYANLQKEDLLAAIKQDGDVAPEDLERIESELASLEVELGTELTALQTFQAIRNALPSGQQLLLDSFGLDPTLWHEFMNNTEGLRYMVAENEEVQAFYEAAFNGVSGIIEQNEIEGRDGIYISNKFIGISLILGLILWPLDKATNILGKTWEFMDRNGRMIVRRRSRDVRTAELASKRKRLKLDERPTFRARVRSLWDRIRSFGKSEEPSEPTSEEAAGKKEGDGKKKNGKKKRKKPKSDTYGANGKYPEGSSVHQRWDRELSTASGESNRTLRIVLDETEELEKLDGRIESLRTQIESTRKLGPEGNGVVSERLQRLERQYKDLLSDRRERYKFLKAARKTLGPMLERSLKSVFLLTVLGGALSTRAQADEIKHTPVVTGGHLEALVADVALQLPWDLFSANQILDPYGYTRERYDLYFYMLALTYHALKEDMPDLPTRLFSGCLDADQLSGIDPTIHSLALATVFNSEGDDFSDAFVESMREINRQIDAIAYDGVRMNCEG